MKKYNRRFAARYRRFERWHNIACKLSEFDELVKPFDGATPEDVGTLKAIHKKLYECSVMAHQHLDKSKITERTLR